MTRQYKYTVFERDHYKCGYCGIPVIVTKSVTLPPNEGTLDHIKPRSKGGETSLDNLVTCCNRCNNILGDKFETLEEKRKYITKFIKKHGRETLVFNADKMQADIATWEREQRKRERVRLY